VLIVLLLVNLALRLGVALRPLEYIDGLTIIDDAYLSLDIARNIAAGDGMVYDGKPTSGFQPLYVFLMVPAYWLFPGDPVVPVHVALVLLALFDTLTLLLLWRLVARTSTHVLAPAVVGLAWATSPYVIATTLNGLETAIASFFLVAAFSYYVAHFRQRRSGGRESFVLGILLGLGILARIDLAFLGVVLTAALVLRERAAALKAIALVAAGVLVTYGPYLLYSYSLTGDLFPVSGKAVRLNAVAALGERAPLERYAHLAWSAGRIMARNTWPMLLLAAILIAKGKLRSFLDNARWLSPLALCSLALALVYVFYLPATWYFGRYLFFATILLVLLVGALVETLCSLRPRPPPALAGLLLVLAAGSNLADGQLLELYTSTDTKTLGYMNLGLWARSQFEDGTVVGSAQTGALGYFADNLRVVNLDGVVNEDCYESLRTRTNMQYIQDSGVEYVIGWPTSLKFIESYTDGFDPDDLVYLYTVEGFTSWGVKWMVHRVRR
jgi:hypothetical protein